MNPSTIRNQRFLLVRRGYDPEAVLAFLDEVAGVLEAAGADDLPEGEATVDLVAGDDPQRLVDEARTRAATQRLRAQRDIEALQRTARARRARLVAEIEELALARDHLADDLEQAVDVVDRVAQWVRRTDPADAVGVTAADRGIEPGHGPLGAGLGDDVDDLADDPDRHVEVETDLEAVPDADDDHAADDADPGVTGEPDVEPDVDVESGADHETGGPADPAVDPVDPGDPGDPAVDPVGPVEQALEAVRVEVLANLERRPDGVVEDWVPSTRALVALDDAATPMAGRAFLAGWEAAAGPAVETPEPVDGDRGAMPVGGSAIGRDALEEVRGAGRIPGLAIADDLRIAIRASLQRGLDAGERGHELVERLAEVHRDAHRTVLPDALERVAGSARHEGMLARWGHDGITAIAWVLGEEQRCPGRRCRGNAVEGTVAPGEPFAFGDVVPPAHAGCTCTLRSADEDTAAA